MKKHGLLFLAFFATFQFELLAETGRKMPESRFWKEVSPLGGSIDYTGFPNEQYSNKQIYVYKLHCPWPGKWFLVGDGNGQVWKLNDSLIWERVDKTTFFGYNYNALIFPGICKYGGYGFWKTNGILSQFLYSSKEWETRRLSRELPTNGGFCFFDNKKNSIYQIGYNAINSALTNEYSFSDTIYFLDLYNNKWKNIGALHPDILKLVSQSYTYHSTITYKNGLLFFNWKYAESCIVDLENLNCIVLNDAVADSLEVFFRRKFNGEIVFTTEYGIWAADTADFSITDSLSWAFILSNSKRTLPLINKAEALKATTYYGIGLTGLLLAWGVFYWVRKVRKKSAAVPEINNEKNGESLNEIIGGESAVQSGFQFFILSDKNNEIFINDLNLKQKLGNQALMVMKVLLEKRRLNEVLNTVQLNELLEIDKRSIDNQKKIRSEVVKSINHTFHELGFHHDAVQRNRLEDDRRMMVYYLHEEITVQNIPEQ